MGGPFFVVRGGRKAACFRFSGSRGRSFKRQLAKARMSRCALKAGTVRERRRGIVHGPFLFLCDSALFLRKSVFSLLQKPRKKAIMKKISNMAFCGMRAVLQAPASGVVCQINWNRKEYHL